MLSGSLKQTALHGQSCWFSVTVNHYAYTCNTPEVINLTLLASLIAFRGESCFRSARFEWSRHADVGNSVIFSSNFTLLMFCRDNGLSVVPDTLFKVSKLLAVTRFGTPAREGKQAAYSSFLRGKQPPPLQGAALQSILEMFYLKAFFQLIYGEAPIVCAYQFLSVSFWGVAFVIFCLTCSTTCRYVFIYNVTNMKNLMSC